MWFAEYKHSTLHIVLFCSLVYSLLSSFLIVKGMNFTMTNSQDWLPHFTVIHTIHICGRDYMTNIFGMWTGFMGCTLTVMGKIEGECKCTTVWWSMIIIMGKSIHTPLCPFCAPANLKIYCQISKNFHLLMRYVMMTGCLMLYMK